MAVFNRYNDSMGHGFPTLRNFGCLQQHRCTCYHKAAQETGPPCGKTLAPMAINDYIGKGYAIKRYSSRSCGR